MSSSSFCKLRKKFSLILCLNVLMLFDDFNSDGRLFHILGPRSRTEIQGGPGGPWPPQKFSIVVAVNLYSFISISEYQISTPFSYVYLVQFLPFISLGSHLAVFTRYETCPTPELYVHPNIDLPVKSICIEERKLALF